MFQLSVEEARLVLQGHPNTGRKSNWSQSVTSYRKHRGLSYRPYAFTEQGVAMFSSVLRSPRAVPVNIEIMRAFLRLRQMLASNVELARRLEELEAKYDGQFRLGFDAIRRLMREVSPPKPRLRREIGFLTLRDKGNARPPRRVPVGPVQYRIRRSRS